MLIFRQLFEPDSSTYTYVLGCVRTRQAVLIDPVLDTVQRDLEVLRAEGLTLACTMDTHIHADHLTGARKLKALTGCCIAYPEPEAPPCADVRLSDGEIFDVGDLAIEAVFAPGHTSHHFCYVVDNGTQKMAFTGDVLLIDACGRTDFQSGDPIALYKAIHERLFTLPDETLVYPGHDYDGRFVSSIAQEKKRNPRLGGGKSLEEFVAIMRGLDLPYPRKIDFAVPGNRECGLCPPDVPAQYRAPCDFHEQG